jgi:hypothetical protein
MSYHLKELVPLVEQSERGKYRLSEVGQTSFQLFRKVEGNKQQLDRVVEKSIEKYTSKVFFLAVLCVVAFMGTMSFDILMTVESLETSFSAIYLWGLFASSFLVMVLISALFVVYDARYYRPATLKAYVVHAALFALAISIVTFLASFQVYAFRTGFASATLNSNGDLATLMHWLAMARSVAFVGLAPAVAYLLKKKRFAQR